VWVVGDEAVARHFDGTTWSDVATGLDSSVSLGGVWGSAPDDLWVAASGGTFLRWTGSTFAEVTAPDGSFAAVHGCAASPDGNTWAVGSTGGSDLILRWTGSAWTPTTSPTTTGTGVSDVHCAGPDDAWAVSGRSILRWDGATWTEAQTTTGGSLEAITVDGAGHVWAVGSVGRVEHYDGATWSRPDSGADDALTALWSDSTSVVAGGVSSVVLRHDL
jgi:hypothetical protein